MIPDLSLPEEVTSTVSQVTGAVGDVNKVPDSQVIKSRLLLLLIVNLSPQNFYSYYNCAVRSTIGGMKALPSTLEVYAGQVLEEEGEGEGAITHPLPQAVEAVKEQMK